MIFGSAFLTCRPCQGSTSAVNCPFWSTGLKKARFSRWPTWKSSSPNAGARCTMPVPESRVTKSAATILKASVPSGTAQKGSSCS